MPRASILEYLENFYRHGRETAYAQRRGYRMQRWSYRQVAETAFQFARDSRDGLSPGCIERILKHADQVRASRKSGRCLFQQDGPFAIWIVTTLRTIFAASWEMRSNKSQCARRVPRDAST